MKEPSSNSSYSDRIRSWANSKTHGGSAPVSLLPISNPPPTISSNTVGGQDATLNDTSRGGNVPSAHSQHQQQPQQITSTDSSSTGGGGHHKEDSSNGAKSPTATSHQAAGQGPELETTVSAAAASQEGEQEKQKPKNFAARIGINLKKILLHNKLVNLMLVFVPVGIVVSQLPNSSPGLVFAMNALAIVPLAGLLSYATESVARKLGDSLGALLNVTFGNAVELIILTAALTLPVIYIALVKNQINIVQASLLGSILANLLLILGMSFLLGGLRFREQIYNSTVTQMSACLLSLSVISLVLPTAFHASFKDENEADEKSLKISRGTSIILLLVYVIYLLFQLLSHSYLYESTPQHIIDEESTPGPAAGWLDSSSSDSDSSTDSDSSDSDYSRETVSKRMKRVMRGGHRRRKSSIISNLTSESVVAGPARTPSFGTSDVTPGIDESTQEDSSSRPGLAANLHSPTMDGNNEEAVEDEKHYRKRHRYKRHMKKHRKHKHKKHHHNGSQEFMNGQTIDENAEAQPDVAPLPSPGGEPRRVDFAVDPTGSADNAQVEGAPGRRPFPGLRGMSLRPVARNLAPAVFVTGPDSTNAQPVPSGPVPRVRYGIRRTNSLPDRLSQSLYRPQGALMPSQIPMSAVVDGAVPDKDGDHPDDLSRFSAVILLLVSTALVAVCAEFMVDSIHDLVETAKVPELFIGLIILPIVGNAAEHVTAITVAMKNKMDLAIGVAVGSSIQIALFITPLVVIIGWIMDRDMTLYFTLFETVCLFVSAFIVNFLVLDGRSNYLEGALLCATYVIIALVSFYSPNPAPMGGGE
ncbi:Sodium/calcium exchanger protein-domain-containing protein [Sordaria brevicollis]|uniref:Sodium/calcium exchanger protein-domain-containing protein n=1 Tax=Sordaria brevicollis TaxID=83679 RepID=A0AAE0NVD5_SORBR|nr:Sodium/calcium exchanger protein-domain-containing protein [Sordaria brevicollis]